MINHFLHKWQQPLGDPIEYEEIKRYDDGRRRYDKTIREKGGIEYYLVSKKFIKQWKYYVDYYEEMGDQQKEARKKPDKMNSDLQCNEKVFKYIPEDHVYNSSIRYLENEWDYEYILKEVFDIFKEKYSSIEPQKRIGFYSENEKKKVVYPNLARFTLIYQSLRDNKFYSVKAQVDHHSEIKAWLDLLKATFQDEFKQKQISNIRIWLPRHQHLKVDLLTEQIEQTMLVDGDVLQENLMVFQLQANRDNCLILDFESNQWQFNKMDQQQQIENDIELLFNRASKGCGKYVCDFAQCKLNNGFLEQDFSQDDIKGICQQLVENEEVNWESLCYPVQSINDKLSPFQTSEFQIDLHEATLRISFQLEIFGASFVENYYNKAGIYQIDPQNAEVDTNLIIETQKRFIKYKGDFSLIINNLFSQREKNLEQLTNLYQLRALYLILQFRRFLESIIDEKSQIILKIIRRLNKPQKQQLSRWFTNLSKAEFEGTTKVVKKLINSEILRQQHTPLMPFLEIEDTQKMVGLFELFQILKISNKMNTRLQSSDFVIDLITKLYKQDADKEEFSQFRYYAAKQWRNYSFTFCLYAWSIPIEFKSKLLSLDCKVKQHDSMSHSVKYHFTGQAPYLNLSIERNNIIESAIKQLQITHIPLKNPLKVQFIGEQGVDEGGPKREFFRLMMEKLISPDYGMFIPKNNGTVYWFNPQSFEIPIYYSLIGKLLGLALYNQVLLDVRFPTVLFKKLQNEKVTEEDLKELDMEIYTGFQYLREQTDSNLIQSLALNFNASYVVWGEAYFDDLKPNGFQINVTKDNREEYIELYTDWYLNKLVKNQFDLLHSGFKSVVDGDGIKLFSGEELQALIIGLPHFDLKDLELVTKYDGFDDKSEYIRYFWSCIHSLSIEMQKRFLFFCTGTDRIPVGGLKSIKFVIQKHGEDTEQLPSAHTCFNVLLLPLYKKKETLKDKLMISLDNAEGFGLM
ncbi:unnamed protein product [Paramecium octaurelia]|uniref:HECT-type E3 ubiquitin transferase n=1 Tax=Paramecium octaurelia TaxID=43137 RepID=A0A8S1XJW2_PAROT|nr:unnamed protein product [Paramecium octaurelia]